MKKAICVLVCAAALASCNPTYIEHDYDQDVDFSKFRTFAWMEQSTMTAGEPQAFQQSGLLEARIKRAVNDGLTQKGLRLVEAEPDLMIAYHIGVQDYTEIRRTGYSYQIGGSTRVDQFQEGTFILDLIAAKEDRLVWRWTAEGVLEENPTPEKLDRDVNNMVQRLLRKYPPPGS